MEMTTEWKSLPTMHEEMKAGQATPREELERQIMSSLVPKNEREHWAASEIKSLREQLADSQKHVAILRDAILDVCCNPEVEIFISGRGILQKALDATEPKP